MKIGVALCVAALAIGLPGGAAAQGLDTLGPRAAGMVAFVAVADDASAVAWNPAGLAAGPFFNLLIDLGRSTEISTTPVSAGSRAGRAGSTMVALGSLPLGLAYYRARLASSVPSSPAATDDLSRQTKQVFVRSLVTDHLGASVVQSVGEYLTFGATLKAVWGRAGGASSAEGSAWETALDRADAAAGSSRIRGDVDVGAMVSAGPVRAGLVVRNLAAPAFGDRPEARVRLHRHARAGVAWGDGWPGRARTIVALDVDLTRAADATGERRDVAAGVERWVARMRLGLRAGVRASTTGEARPAVRAGASYAVASGAYVDVHVGGGAREARSWGIAARVSY